MTPKLTEAGELRLELDNLLRRARALESHIIFRQMAEYVISELRKCGPEAKESLSILTDICLQAERSQK